MTAGLVSVIVPAYQAERFIDEALESAFAQDYPDVEVIVVDDGSTDRTAELAAGAGARVVAADSVLADLARGPGKGQAMWKGLARSCGDIVVFLDGDLIDFDPSYVTALVNTLATRPGAALVKGRYERGGTGGRVNELVARPAIDLLHPSLSGLTQPLGGEYAAWRSVLEEVPFVHGYGVDLALVLDIAALCGAGAVVEAELTIRSQRNRPLGELRPQARLVLNVALHRAGLAAVAPPECPPLSGVVGYQRRTA